MTESDGRAPRSAVTGSARSRSFVTILDDGRAVSSLRSRDMSPRIAPHSREASPMTVSNGRAPRSAVTGYADLARSSRFRTTEKRISSLRSRDMSPRIAPHSREAPLMTVSDGRAPRSAVLGSAEISVVCHDSERRKSVSPRIPPHSREASPMTEIFTAEHITKTFGTASTKSRRSRTSRSASKKARHDHRRARAAPASRRSPGWCSA